LPKTGRRQSGLDVKTSRVASANIAGGTDSPAGGGPECRPNRSDEGHLVRLKTGGVDHFEHLRGKAECEAAPIAIDPDRRASGKLAVKKSRLPTKFL
jgi:hypothetical protein